MEDHVDIMCPISKQIFKNPVVASDGYIYEKDCIEQWFKTKQTSPMTNKPLTNTNINEVFFIKNFINEAVKKNPELLKDQYTQPENPLESLRSKYKNIIDNNNYQELLNLKDIDIHILINLVEDHDFPPNNFFKNIAIIKHIIDNCTDINAIIKSNWRLIHYMCWAPSPPEVIKYIIDKDVDLEVTTSRCNKPVHFVAIYSTSDVLMYMLQKGVLTDAVDENGATLDYYIFSSHNINMIKYAISKKIGNPNCYHNKIIFTRLACNPHILLALNKENFMTDFFKLIEQ